MFILLLLGVTLLDYFDIVTGLFDVPEKTTSDVALFIILAIMALGAFVLDCIRVRKLRHEIDELEQENRTASDKKSL
jgi:hypothetical protein